MDLEIFVFEEIKIGTTTFTKKPKTVFAFRVEEIFIPVKVIFKMLSRPPTNITNFKLHASLV